MSAAVAKANLLDALKQLKGKWDRVRTNWDDDTARKIDAESIRPLEARILTAAKGLDHLIELSARVKRECGVESME